MFFVGEYSSPFVSPVAGRGYCPPGKNFGRLAALVEVGSQGAVLSFDDLKFWDQAGGFFWVSIVSMGLNLVGGDWNHGIL